MRPLPGGDDQEAREEAGIEIKPQDLEFKLVMHRKPIAKVGFFSRRANTAESCAMPSRKKCSELGWFDINNLPENIIPYIKKSIELLDSGIKYYEFGWE